MSLREHFLYDEGIYLLSHSVGLPPADTLEVWQSQFLEPWQGATEDNWPTWLSVIDGFRGAVGRLLAIGRELNNLVGLHRRHP